MSACCPRVGAPAHPAQRGEGGREKEARKFAVRPGLGILDSASAALAAAAAETARRRHARGERAAEAAQQREKRGRLTSHLHKVPVAVAQRAHLARLQPARDAVKVEGVVCEAGAEARRRARGRASARETARVRQSCALGAAPLAWWLRTAGAPGDGALLGAGRGLVGLALDACGDERTAEEKGGGGTRVRWRARHVQPDVKRAGRAAETATSLCGAGLGRLRARSVGRKHAHKSMM